MELFKKSKIKNMTLKNKFFKAASWEALATETGHMTSELSNVYEELAKGGVGTIITGYAFVTENEKPNPRMMGIYNDSFIEEYKELTKMVHKYNTNIIMQIVYGGSMSGLAPHSEKILGPSAVENERTKITPIEMTKEDIKFVVQSFVDAAYRVKESGFDGVELHGAHGYLLSQFLCSAYNTRTDEYGGSIENRSRIIVEIVKNVRDAVGEEFPIMIKLNSEDFMDNGLTSDESIIVSKILEKAGIDAIEISGGNESSLKVANKNLGPARTKVSLGKDKESYFSKHAARLAKEVNIPIILTGGNRHFDIIENIAKETKISYFALSRPLICEPDLINKWEDGELKKPKCISCNQCFHTYGKRCIFNVK